MLKWAALLHDIRKLSRPIIEGKDHSHAFKSSENVISIFKQLGLLEDDQNDNLLQIQRLISESIQPLPREELDAIEFGIP